LKPDGATTIGRQGADVAFPEDLGLSDIHARIVAGPQGYRLRDEGSAEGVFLQPAGGRLVNLAPGTIFRAGRQWLVIGDEPAKPSVIHYDSAGRRLGRYELKAGTAIFGRNSPDVTIAPDDSSLSRRHFATVVQDSRIGVKDLGSGNGTYIKVAGEILLQDGDRIHLGSQVLQFTDESQTSGPQADISLDTSLTRLPPSTHVKQPTAGAAQAKSPAAPAPQAAPPAPAQAAPVAAAADGQPSVTFNALNRLVPCTKGQTICEAAEHVGIKIDADCHAGVCGMDPVRVLSGGEHLGPLGSAERSTLEDLCSLEPGPHRLACMARVSGPVVVDIVKQ
jgi:pSer/pThr/pTyr-binding forkhead associated (FHA) protein/ferredoxin